MNIVRKGAAVVLFCQHQLYRVIKRYEEKEETLKDLFVRSEGNLVFLEIEITREQAEMVIRVYQSRADWLRKYSLYHQFCKIYLE